MSRTVEVVRTYLELRAPEQLRPAPAVADARFVELISIDVPRYRQLYESVGAPWHWHDRDAWSDERLAAHLARSDVRIWECRVANDCAGFFELERHDDASVEIAYFGLTQHVIGRGLGKAMLTRAVQEAWSFGVTRVWLHTCTLDSPHALPNYKARGFEETRHETFMIDV